MKMFFGKIGRRIKNAKVFSGLVLLSSLFLLLISAKAAYAQQSQTTFSFLYPSTWIPGAITFIVSLCVGLEGLIITILTKILFQVVKYSNFTNSQAVSIGWNIVRDITNLFFVVILLAIALATILRVESYNFKRLLPKLLLMAVLVNFSKTICGLIIDFAQVIMMTFVAGFATIAGEGNLINALHVNDIVSAGLSTGGDMLAYEIGAVLMVIMLLITIMVILVILVVLTVRIVMLWVLIVLSPLAYILSAFPQGQRYAQQWWSEFSKYVIIGPVLAFFLWLTFAVASVGDIAEKEGIVTTIQATNSSIGQQFVTGGGTVSGNAVSAISAPTKMYSFIIAIAMLLASLMITQQMGVAGGSFAGQMYGKIRQGGKALGSLGGRLGGGLKNLGGRRLDNLQAGILKYPARWLAPGLQKVPGLKGVGRGLQIIGEQGGLKLRTLPAAWKERSERLRKKELGLGVEATTDFLNRAMPFGKKNTNKVVEGRRRQQLEEIKKLDEFGDDSASLSKGVIELLDPKTAGFKKGKEDQAQVMLERLAKKGDWSTLQKEILKSDTAGAKMLKTELKGAEQDMSTFDGVKKFLNAGFGEKRSAESAFYLSPAFESAGDFHLGKLASMKDGKADWNKESDQQGAVTGKVVSLKRLGSELSLDNIASKVVTYDPNAAEKDKYKTTLTPRKYIEDERVANQFTREALTRPDRFSPEIREELGKNPDFVRDLYGALTSSMPKEADKKEVAQALALLSQKKGDKTPNDEALNRIEGIVAGSGSGAKPSAPRMAQDFDQAKYKRTEDKIKEFEEVGMSATQFFGSDQWNTNDYEDKNEFLRHRAVKQQKELNEVRGVSSAGSPKLEREQAGVGLNFSDKAIQDRLGVKADIDGAVYSGKEKDAAIPEIINVYKKQLEQSGKEEGEVEDMANRLEKGLQAAETIRITNNNSLSSRRDIAEHEKAHPQIDKLNTQQLDKVWETINKSQQAEMAKDIKTRYKGMLTDEQVKKEALAELIGVGKGKYQAGDKTRQALAEAGIKRIRGGQAAGKVQPVPTKFDVDKVKLKAEERKELFEASSATHDREDIEKQISSRRKERADWQKQYTESAAKAKTATEAGDANAAERHAATANEKIKSIQTIDRVISDLEKGLAEAKKKEGEAISKLFSRLKQSGIKLPISEEALKEKPPSTVVKSLTTALDREVIKSAPKLIEGTSSELEGLAKGGDSQEIISALANMERLLGEISNSLKTQGPGRDVFDSSQEIKKALSTIAANRTTVQRGGVFDPQSVVTLLFKINQNLKNLSKDAGEKPPTTIPPQRAKEMGEEGET